MHNGGICGQGLQEAMQKKVTKKSYKNMVFIILMSLTFCGCSTQPDFSVAGFQVETGDGRVDETEVYLSEDCVEIGIDSSGMTVGPKTGQNSENAKTEIRVSDGIYSVETETGIQVYVCGAVECPGVYCLRENVRIYEAVEAAGGFRPEADQEWLNQAGTLQDGEKLRIYTLEETSQMRTNGQTEQGISVDAQGEHAASSSAADGKINLNTADREQLMTLPGIGESKAEAVISYREEHGMFQKIEEIMNISGIKEAVFLKIKDKIVV